MNHTPLQKILAFLAKKIIEKYQPTIIGVTGTVGKTSTKEAITLVLSQFKTVRGSFGNHNNELGLPLTVIGDYKEATGVFFWLGVIWDGVKKIIFQSEYPEFLVLEYAADKPGDIRYLTEIARPNVAVVTAIGDMPAHAEFYSSKEALVREKSRLVEAVPSNGIVILNADDLAVMTMETRSKAKVFKVGFYKESDLRIFNFENRSHKLDGGYFRPDGISFKLEHKTSVIPIIINGVFGKSYSYALTNAVAVGLAFGFNLVKIAGALQYYHSIERRMRVYEGIRHSYIIDDTYNASPLSVSAALETLHELESGRKVAILGDMLELGDFSEEAHYDIGKQASKIVGLLITVGERAKLIAEAAIRFGFNEENVKIFNSTKEAKKSLRKLINENDLILVKASRRMKLEELVKELKK